MIKSLFEIQKQKENGETDYIIKIKKEKKVKYIFLSTITLIALIVLSAIYSIISTQSLRGENELYKKQLQMADEKLKKLEEKSETVEKMALDIQKMSITAPTNGQGGADKSTKTNELKTIKKNSRDPQELLKKIHILDKKFNAQMLEFANQKHKILYKHGTIIYDKECDTPTIWPCDGKITSPFGLRVDPITGEMKVHEGIDISTEYGNAIYATACGTVTKAEYEEGYGNVVEIKHNDTITTLYAHNSVILVNSGQKVEKGTVIALAGSTGYSTGPHSHYEVRINGKTVNPMPFMHAKI